MSKAELGAKRRCLSCGAAFFDLHRDPITCPKCAAVFQVVELPRSPPRRGPYRPAPAEARVVDDESSRDDVLADAEPDEAEAEDETEEAEADDSIPEPIEDDEKIEEIDDLI